MAVALEYVRNATQTIPSDWTLQRLSDIAEASWGNTAVTKSSYQDFGYAAYSASGPDGFVGWYEHDKSAVVLSAIGAQCGKTWLASGKWTPIKNTIWFAANVARADTKFLYYITANPEFWPNRGQAQPFIALGDVRNALVPLPPTRAEQQAIAEALSDADAFVEAVERLIQKKHAVKRGIMQALLSGAVRLPTFDEVWPTVRVGNLGATFGGLTGKTKADFGHGTARYIPFMNIMTNIVIDCDSLEEVNVRQTETQNRVRIGDLFFNGSSETPEEVGMCSVLMSDVDRVYLNSFCFGFRLNSALADGLYLAYYFRSGEGRNALGSLAQGSTRYNLSKTALKNIRIPLPTIGEQRAIVRLLSDVDAEIMSLREKLDKARDIREGVMENLLTGRVRLV